MAVEVACCQCIGLEHVGGCSFEHNLPPLAAGFRADVDYIVGIEHHILVVFYDDNRVLGVAQFL